MIAIPLECLSIMHATPSQALLQIGGTEVVYGDLLLDGGVITSVQYVPEEQLLALRNQDVVDAEGKWVSPGLGDAHSHLDVHPAPGLAGSADRNSPKALILPSRLRSIDGRNTCDDAYAVARACGVTTAQILPGNANNIGFLIKTRQMADVGDAPGTATHFVFEQHH
ncbi:hypothetical protein C8J57DRAFT_1612725 [Mycena rebaudengoi]|nr:hypothetical protein C8J57DRAFT_1612725 [Mycena rebaudengoi]